MKVTEAQVGMRLKDRFWPHRLATVTELTERGFKYVLDVPYCIHPLWGTVSGGEHFGSEGESQFDPIAPTGALSTNEA